LWRGSLLPLRAELVVLARANGPSGGVVETVVIVHKKGGWWHCIICRCETLLSSGRVRGLHEGEKEMDELRRVVHLSARPVAVLACCASRWSAFG
jgi:hypothetical protein